MAFTVEDGSVVSGANSYLSVADADTYHSDRGNSLWTGATAVKQAALIRATDYIEQKYTGRWIGELVEHDQALQWPRSGFDEPDYNELPTQLKQAVALLALEALSADLNPALDRGGMVKREKVDVIETEYMDGALPGKKRPAIDGLLRRFLTGSSLNVPTVRV